MPTRSALAVLATGCLLLAACGTDVAAGPQGALQERLDRGVSVEVTLEADPAGLDDPDAAAGLRRLLDEQAADGPMLIASRSGDGVARGVVLRGGDLEVRLVDDTAYLRADAAALDEFTAGRLDLSSPDVGAGADDGPLALLGALDGGWIGIGGLTEDRLAELAGADDVDVPTDADEEALDEMLDARDLDDLDGLFTTYSTVTGDGPWQVEVHARELARALEDVATEADGLLGEALGTPTPGTDPDDPDPDHDPDHDLDDLPERVGGVTVEAADGVATRVQVDLATILGALDEVDGKPVTETDDADRAEQLEMLRAADAHLVLTMVDVEDRVDTPADASVVDVAILEAVLGADGSGDSLLDDLPAFDALPSDAPSDE